MQLLQRPALLHEVGAQVIEQFRMARLFRLRAEIIRRAHKAFTEMVQPHTVDDHPRRERIVLAGDGLRQFKSSAAVLERRRVASGEDLQEVPRNDVAPVFRQAADEYRRIFRAAACLPPPWRARRRRCRSACKALILAKAQPRARRPSGHRSISLRIASVVNSFAGR